MNRSRVHIKTIKVKKKRLLTVIFVIVIVLYLALGGYKNVMKIFYPQRYDVLVTEYAQQNGLDKNLVYALIKAESNFDERALSTAGAIGLMQLMPETSMECSAALGMGDLTLEQIYEPEINIALGTYYFKKLLDMYDGNLFLATAAYNSGPGRVSSWMKDERYYNTKEGLLSIPFLETERYTENVAKNYSVYTWLYGK